MANTSTPEPGRPGSPVTTATRCERCDVELVTIRMTVDRTEMVMESCQKCDTRRWHLGGERIDLQQALAEVGEHAGRRR